MKYSEDGITYIDTYIKALDSMPIGSIISFAGENIPNGWLVCNGEVVSSTDYPDLFAEIGNKYGGTSPSFKLPDLRGRVPVGLDPTDQLEEFDTLGNSGGSRTDNLSNAYAKVGRSSDSITSLSYKAKSGSGTFDRKQSQGLGFSGSAEIITDATELGGSVSTLQPYLVVNFIIKAKNTTPTMASVVNATNDSTEDTYSCYYLNNRVKTIESGLITSNNMTSATLGGNTGRKYNLTFEHTYETPPNVIVSYYNNASSSYGAIEVGFGQITTTGCELYIFYDINNLNAGISYIVQGTSTD